MADGRRQSAIVASVGRNIPPDPSGRYRLERIDRASLVDYAAYADCFVLSEPGGGLLSLESLRDVEVPTLLYDTTADPTVAERATQLGVTEYVAGRTDDRGLHDRIAAVVGIGTSQTRRGQSKVVGQHAPAIKAISEAKQALRSADDVEAIAEIAVETAETAAAVDSVGVQLLEDGEPIVTVATGDDQANHRDFITIDQETMASVLERGDVVLGDGSGVSPHHATATIPIGDRGVMSVESQRGPIGGPARRLLSALATDVESALGRLDRCVELHHHEEIHGTTDQFAFVVDDGRIELLTRALAERFGIDADRMVGSQTEALFACDLWERYRSEISEETATFETAIRTNGGMYPVTVELSTRESSPLSNELLGLVQERTERTSHRNDPTTANRFRHLFDQLPDAVVDVEFRENVPFVRGVNRAFEETFGYDESNVLDESLADLIVPERPNAETGAIDEALIQRSHDAAEVERMTAEGKRTFLFRGFSYRDDGGNQRGFGIYTDITDRLEQERRLHVLHRVLRHNLRNEITAITGYANILAKNASSQEHREFAKNIYEQATDVSKLGEQVRRIEQALDVDRQQVALDPEPLVTEITEWFQSTCPQATIHVSVDIDGKILADELLKIAIENLVENAIQHHPDNATVEIQLGAVDETWFDITIRDDGPGIPERERAVVGGDRDITQLDHSMGLGLWVSRWVVRGVDGQLLFGEQEGGSEVTLRLRRPDGAAAIE